MVAPRTVRCLCNRLWTHFSPRCLVFCKEGVRHRWRSEISWTPPKWKLLNTVFPMVILTSIPENRKFQMSGSLHPCQPLKRWGGCSLAGLRTGHGWREISGVFPITKKIYQTKVYSKPLKRKVGNSSSWEFSLAEGLEDMMSLKNFIFKGHTWPAKKKQFHFLRKYCCLTVSYSLRGLPRKILGTCFLICSAMFLGLCVKWKPACLPLEQMPTSRRREGEMEDENVMSECM